MDIDKFKETLKVNSVACFGSRETPDDILKLMWLSAKLLSEHGAQIRSGHCEGADWAFERGCYAGNPLQMVVCLPWTSYNNPRTPEGVEMPIHKDAFIADLSQPDDNMELRRIEQIAAKYHPKWSTLTRGPRALHTRNILIGEPAAFGIGYLNTQKIGGGGSGQAYRYLTGTGRRVIELQKPGVAAWWAGVLKQLVPA
jgi:hypothetical protein